MGCAERLEQIRRESGLSQAEVAEAASVHLVQMSGYETGRALTSVEAVKGLAIELSVSTDDLIFEPGESIVSRDGQLLFVAVQSLDKKRRDAVKALIEAAVLAYEEAPCKESRPSPPPGRPRGKKG